MMPVKVRMMTITRVLQIEYTLRVATEYSNAEDCTYMQY